MQERSGRIFIFQEFRLDPVERCLWRGQSLVPLAPKAFDILVLFVEHPGQLLEKEFILARIWSNRVVEETNLSVYISALRKSMGDSAATSHFIETVPTKGYRFVAPVEVRTSPQEAAETTEHTAGSSPAAGPQEPGFFGRFHLNERIGIFALFLIGILGVLLANSVKRQPPAPNVLTLARIHPFTNAPGVFSGPAFSRDGRWLAYAWDSGKPGSSNLYMQEVGAETPVKLTSGAGLSFAPAWSPDRSQMAFLHCRELGSTVQLFRLSTATKEIAQPIAELSAASTLDWSPDGKALLASDATPSIASMSLVSISPETGQKRFLTNAPIRQVDGFGRFSPDGATVAFRRRFAASAEDVYIVSLQTGREQRLTFNQRAVCGLSWSEDGGSLVVCSTQGGGLGNLWRVYLDGRRAERLSTADIHAATPAVAPQGKRLAYVVSLSDDNIWRAPADGNRGPEKWIASTFLDSSAAYSPDGSRIAFRSDRTGTNEIWICDSGGQNAKRVTDFRGPVTGSPAWSPDGKSIAFDSRGSGNSDIYTLGIGNGKLVRFTSDPSDEAVPSWSRDGRAIYFSSNRSGKWQIWKGSVEDGAETQVTTNGGFNGVESPDGRYLYYARDMHQTAVWRLSLSSGQETLVLASIGPEMWAYWAVASDALYFLDHRSTTQARMGKMNLKTGRVDYLGWTGSPPAAGDKGMSLSPDRKWLLFTQKDLERTGIMLADSFR
jgi:Tol biopolymer transport system component/DNA-binding winged helix-turn-helix (wHTH) protein